MENIEFNLKQIWNFGDLKGKIIERAVIDNNNKLLIFFTDNTVVVFTENETEYGEYIDSIDISTYHYPFVANEIVFDNAYKIGIISKEQFMKFDKNRVEENNKFKEKEDRDLLRRLKLKYPDK